MPIGVKRMSDPFDVLANLTMLDLSDHGQRFRGLVILEGLFGATCGGFYLADQEGQPSEYVLDNLDSSQLQLYQCIYRKQDPMDPERYYFSPVPRVARLVDVVVSMDEFERTEYYREFLRLCNMHHEMDAYLAWGGRLLGGFFVARPRSYAPFSDDELRLAGRLAEPLAVHLYRCCLLKQLHSSGQIMRDCLADALPSGSFILDAGLTCLYVDGHAEECLGVREGDRWAHPLATLLLSRLEEDRLATVQLVYKGHRVSLSGKYVSDKDRVIILGQIAKGSTPVGSVWKDLAGRFGLSAREVEIVAKVADGASNRQIASDLAISEMTVKTHLKNIFRKLGVASRTELASLAWRWRDKLAHPARAVER